MSRLVPSASICATSWARLEPETPSTATMVAMPSATPTADSAARAGLLTRPRTASGQMSAGRSRLAGELARPRPTRVLMPPRCRARPARRAAGSPGARPGYLRVVGDHEDRRPAAVQLGQQGEDARTGRRVQAAGRLVGQDDGGPPTRARAMATRWHSPPDSSAGRWPARPDRPTSASAPRRPRARRARGHPRYSSPVATLSSAVRSGTRKNCWNTNPIRSARTRTAPCRAARPRPARPPGPGPRSGVPGRR